MLNIGPQELLIILVIALLVVGPQRLPALGRSLGRGLRELRKAQDEVKRTIQVNLDDEPANGRSRRRPAATTQADRAGSPSVSPTPPAVPADPTPTASEQLPASEIRELSRSLGRSLSELRRAREEVQRSFRIDVRPSPPTSSPTRADAPSAEPDPEAGPATRDRMPEGAPTEPMNDGPPAG